MNISNRFADLSRECTSRGLMSSMNNVHGLFLDLFYHGVAHKSPDSRTADLGCKVFKSGTGRGLSWIFNLVLSCLY